MFRANTVYEGEYLLGTSIARPLITGVWLKSPVRTVPTRYPTAQQVRATTQVRYELRSRMPLDPDIKVIAPGASGT